MTSDSNHKLLFARQAIFDSKLNVVAYELLYRETKYVEQDISNAETTESYNATANVLTNFFANVDIEALSNNHKLFINFNTKHLVNDVPLLLPKDNTVIEILESCKVDNTLLYELSRYQEAGYTIALDDFVLNDHTQKLLPFANIIKLDVENKSEQALLNTLESLSDYKGQLLAEKVETNDCFRLLQPFKFDYFQGYFFAEPDLYHGETVTVNRVNILRLLDLLCDPCSEISDIEEVLSFDAKLTYRLLLICNSVYYRGYEPINNIRDAIIRVGVNKIKTWALLLLVQDMESKSEELIQMSLIRARMCELISKTHFPGNADTFYLVGILSNIDALLNEPMADLIERLPVNQIVKDALLKGEGRMGQLLNNVKEYEKGCFYNIDNQTTTYEELTSVYDESIDYARIIFQSGGSSDAS